MDPIIIGIAAGTGSGKTTVAARIAQAVGEDRVVIIPQDAYYKDHSHLPLIERDKLNYDHPDAFDTPLLREHLQRLRAGQPIDMPIYDYVTHSRRPERKRVEPREVIILEGILVFYDPEIRALLDVKIFVETPDDIRFIRRLLRDIQERGRTLESVVDQYLSTVRPMHLEFVEPTKRFADIIIPEGGYNDVAVEMVVSTIFQRLRKRGKVP